LESLAELEKAVLPIDSDNDTENDKGKKFMQAITPMGVLSETQLQDLIESCKAAAPPLPGEYLKMLRKAQKGKDEAKTEKQEKKKSKKTAAKAAAKTDSNEERQ